MIFLPPPTAPHPVLQTQEPRPGPPAPLIALAQAKNWTGMADWFEAQSPQIRGQYYPLWLQAMAHAGRWDRLLTICEALQPQLEATTGPRLGIYRLYRAEALSHLGRHAEAAAAHAENGRLGYPDGLPNACVEARLGGDWNSLLAYASELLVSQPRNAQAQAWKGEALARLERFPEAEPILQAAVQADPSLAMAWNNLGRCLNERKDWTDALDALNHALALDPKEFEAQFNRGRCLFELKRYADSANDFRAALAQRPDDPVLAEDLRQAQRYADVAKPRKP